MLMLILDTTPKDIWRTQQTGQTSWQQEHRMTTLHTLQYAYSLRKLDVLCKVWYKIYSQDLLFFL